MADRYNLIYSGEQVNTAIGRGLTSLQPTAQTLSDIQKQTVRTNIGAIGASNVYNPNLLINGDFAINQRGESSYTGVNTYTVDRWQHGTSFVTATVLSKGVRLTASTSGTTGSNYFLYNQTIEDYSKYAGKTVTATLAYENNTFVNGKINIRCDTTSNYSTATMSTSGVITFTLTLPSSITSSLKLIITGNHTNGTAETIDLLYAKLELGSIATPFVPPLIAEELPKCQRYYQRLKAYTVVTSSTAQIGWMLAGSTSVGYLMVSLPVSMRISPSIAFSNISGLIYSIGSTAGTAFSNVAQHSTDASNTTVKLYCSGTFTTGQIYTVALASGGTAWIAFDAEIY